MKRASTFLALGALLVLPGCLGSRATEAPNYLRDARIVRVVPAPWYSGVTATLGRTVAEDASGKQHAVYWFDVTKHELDRIPPVGEVCTIAYERYEAIFQWLTGDADVSGHMETVERGQRVMMGKSAVCGSKVYDFSAIPEVDRGARAEH